MEIVIVGKKIHNLNRSKNPSSPLGSSHSKQHYLANLLGYQYSIVYKARLEEPCGRCFVSKAKGN